MKHYKPKRERFEEAPYHCQAHAKWSGRRCSRMALKAQRVCYYHGGAAPQNLEAARRRIADPFGLLLAYELPLLEVDDSEHPMDVGDPD